jgi:hypothetical protein
MITRKCRKLLVLLVTFVMVLSLAGCGKQAIADRKGEMLFYEQDELTDGFYIKNADGTFSPVMSGAEGYGGTVLESTPDRYLWFSNNTYNMKKLIPVLNKKTELIARFSEDSQMPETYTIEKYKDRGYTIGVKLYVDGSSVYFGTSNGDYCSDSQVGSGINGSDLPTEVQLAEFNRKNTLPLSSIDRDLNMLLGLEKNGKYQLGFYIGTNYRSKEAIADTCVFQSENVYKLITPFKKTKDGYFIVRMPQSAEKGYYYICDAGLFYYDK